MTAPPDLRARIDAILDSLLKVCDDLGQLQDGLDDARSSRIQRFREDLAASLAVMSVYFSAHPDLRPPSSMTEAEKAAYLQGRGRVYSFPVGRTKRDD